MIVFFKKKTLPKQRQKSYGYKRPNRLLIKIYEKGFIKKKKRYMKRDKKKHPYTKDNLQESDFM